MLPAQQASCWQCHASRSRTLIVAALVAEVKAADLHRMTHAQRIAAVQAGMSPEQIQDIVLGTVHGMITSGDLVNEMPGRDMDTGPEMPMEQMEQPQ